MKFYKVICKFRKKRLVDYHFIIFKRDLMPDWFDKWNNIFSLLQLLYAILHAVVNLLCCCCVVGPSALPFCHVLFLPFFVISPCSLFCLSVVLSFCLFIFLFYFILIHLSSWEVVLVLLESFCACLGDGKQKVDFDGIGWYGHHSSMFF